MPVKYGRTVTHYKFESNISTKQLHAVTTFLATIKEETYDIYDGLKFIESDIKCVAPANICKV